MANAPQTDTGIQEIPPSDMLDRIVWRLYKLAEIAERTALLPLPIRLLMICILRPAEAITRPIVMRAQVCWELNALPMMSSDVDSVENLLRLGANLMAFAMTIEALPREAFEYEPELDWGPDAMAFWLSAMAIHFALGQRGRAGRKAGDAFTSKALPRPEVRARPVCVRIGAGLIGPGLVGCVPGGAT